MGKPHGIRTARQLRVHRRNQRWHDLKYKKAHLGTALKANPFGGASHAKGIVVEKMYVLRTARATSARVCECEYECLQLPGCFPHPLFPLS